MHYSVTVITVGDSVPSFELGTEIKTSLLSADHMHSNSYMIKLRLHSLSLSIKCSL